ncbi:MAG: YdcF family protein [Candidatus Alcyoniella australis]|nr:YdcF family protein [Candidatus Alcyoniella australis]
MRLNSQWLILFVLVALVAGMGLACDKDSGDGDGDGDDDLDDDVGDDDDNLDDDDDDVVDDDDDDDDLQFPELDPTVCLSGDPVDLQGFNVDYELVDSGLWVQNKNYYLLTLFSELAGAQAIIENNPELAGISAQRDAAIRQAAINCVGDVACYTNALIWSDSEARDAADALVDAFFHGIIPFNLADAHLRPSGMFQMHASLSDEELLYNAWIDAVNGMHEAFYSYAAHLPADQLDAIVADIIDSNPNTMLLFQPLMDVALAAMDYFGRDEAGRYEPLAEGENRAALARIDSIDWDQYRFSIILVPGWGPDDVQTPLHPNGKLHCDLAAARYYANVAPLIVLSGGHVHPDQTPYCEAIEMKKYLMEQHLVPEEAIFVDPHARHTTTNLRNVSRLVFRYGIESDKPALITTDSFQNIYIAYLLNERCRDELGYLPWRKVRRLDKNDSCLLPTPIVLYADPRDPLDP